MRGSDNERNALLGRVYSNPCDLEIGRQVRDPEAVLISHAPSETLERHKQHLQPIGPESEVNHLLGNGLRSSGPALPVDALIALPEPATVRLFCLCLHHSNYTAGIR
jgi:hypothetical protein